MHTSIYPSIHRFIHSSIHPIIHPPIYLSIHPFIHPSIHPPVDPSINPSFHPSTPFVKQKQTSRQRDGCGWVGQKRKGPSLWSQKSGFDPVGIYLLSLPNSRRHRDAVVNENVSRNLQLVRLTRAPGTFLGIKEGGVDCACDGVMPLCTTCRLPSLHSCSRTHTRIAPR
jgi:hypothetical protein